MNVLIVDDDPAIREVLRLYLEREGFGVTEAEDGRAALERAATADLVILDLMLPKKSGWEVAEHLVRDRPELPLLILSVRGSEVERVRGLKLGADDYVVKPFSPSEVVARVQALFRRVGLQDDLTYGELSICTSRREVYQKGALLPLSRLEFDLLLALARHPGMVWRRERLLERVWGPEFPGLTRTVDVRIAALRKKLGDEAESARYIETVHGVGYRFRTP